MTSQRSLPSLYALPIIVLAILLPALLATPSDAGMCDTQENPAATLLLPYFEVDLDNPAAGNTIFTINNARSEPVLAHVTLWTDWSQPTITLDIFLTGYDVQQFNLANVFLHGNWPITADMQSDLDDEISPHGAYRPDGELGPDPIARPEWDGNFFGCIDFFPFYQNPLIFGNTFDRLVDGHTGRPIEQLADTCLGAQHDDNVARGYVTIDSVSRCSVVFPSEQQEGYFNSDGTGIANNANQLWGDWIYIDRENGFAQGDSLVHIEALDGLDALGDGTSDPNVPDPATGYTFYARYTSAGEDNREPLGTSWGTRYLNNDLFAPGGTDLKVWRDPAVDEPAVPSLGFACGSPLETAAGPDWHPLNEALVLAFDEFENVVDLCSRMSCGNCSPPTFSDRKCFPLATQQMSSKDIGFDEISSPWGAGWLYLDLRFPENEGGSFGRLSQSFVSSTHSAQGLFSVGMPAVLLSSACEAFDESQSPDV